MRFYFAVLGCKLNQAEIEELARQVVQRGHSVAPTPAEADWAVVNTCTVTHIADRKTRQLLRQLHRANPALRIAVTGCYAERPEELEGLPGVALTLPNVRKGEVIERILSLEPQSLLQRTHKGGYQTRPYTATNGRGICTATISGDVFSKDGEEASPSKTETLRFAQGDNLQGLRNHASQPQDGAMVGQRLALGHTRALVKIQDGCDNRCAYCIVGLARGPQRSVPPDQVLRQVRQRLAEGYQEIVLTGVSIGAYGRDSAPGAALPPEAGWSLARLVREVLEHTSTPRLRLSSIEPWDLTPELLALWPHPRLCRHIHLPLQSGGDATLARMRRRYTTTQFTEWVNAIRARIPEAAITTDVIVGFPGETDEEFERSYRFVERIGLARLHVFQYSARPGTLAAQMAEPVPAPQAQRRSQRLIALGRELARRFHQQYVHRQVTVLLEGGQAAELRDGLTDNYVRAFVRAPRELVNTFVAVQCTRADERGVYGDLVEPFPSGAAVRETEHHEARGD